jgi:hypothetical protein
MNSARLAILSLLVTTHETQPEVRGTIRSQFTLARLSHVRRVPIATNQNHDVPNSYVNLWLELIVDMKTRQRVYSFRDDGLNWLAICRCQSSCEVASARHTGAHARGTDRSQQSVYAFVSSSQRPRRGLVRDTESFTTHFRRRIFTYSSRRSCT